MATKVTMWKATDGSFHETDGSFHETEAEALTHESQKAIEIGLQQFFNPESVGTRHFEQAVKWIASEFDRKADKPDNIEEK